MSDLVRDICKTKAGQLPLHPVAVTSSDFFADYFWDSVQYYATYSTYSTVVAGGALYLRILNQLQY